MVPALVFSKDLHEADASFNQPAGDQAARSIFLRRRILQPVHFLCRSRLAAEIDRFLRGKLHVRGQFITGDASLQVVIARSLGEMLAIELFQIVKCQLLCGSLEVRWRIEIQDARLSRSDHRALVQRRQKTIRPILDAHHRQLSRIDERDVRGQVLGLTSQAVGQPASHRRSAAQNSSVLQSSDRLAMVVHAGVHRADQRDVINHLAPARAAVRKVPCRTGHAF